MDFAALEERADEDGTFHDALGEEGGVGGEECAVELLATHIDIGGRGHVLKHVGAGEGAGEVTNKVTLGKVYVGAAYVDDDAGGAVELDVNALNEVVTEDAGRADIEDRDAVYIRGAGESQGTGLARGERRGAVGCKAAEERGVLAELDRRCRADGRGREIIHEGATAVKVNILSVVAATQAEVASVHVDVLSVEVAPDDQHIGVQELGRRGEHDSIVGSATREIAADERAAFDFALRVEVAQNDEVVVAEHIGGGRRGDECGGAQCERSDKLANGCGLHVSSYCPKNLVRNRAGFLP